MLCARDFADVVNQLRKENMKKNNRAKLLFAFLGIATFASLVGTVSGSLAWYAYSSRATLSYSGTSVANTVQLQIGIASENKVLSVDEVRDANARIIADNPDISSEEIERLQFIENQFIDFWDAMKETKWDSDDNYYYFAPFGSGLESAYINAYLYSNGYATNSLVPVTSGSYTRGDNFFLKHSPTSGTPFNTNLADKNYYAVVPFVFRVMRSNTTDSNDFVEGSELWLVDAKIRASGSTDGDIYKAVRMYIDRGSDYEDDFIVNPSATIAGKTTVGGLLNISGDDYYDYDSNNNEIVYGEFETLGETKPSYDGPNEIVDLNGTGKTEVDSFTAKHRQGINYYENYEECVFKSAEYESLSSIAPRKDEISGRLFNKDENHPTSVCKTAGADDHFLGRVDFTIYLEGWDHSVIDQELNHYFDLGLTFEINKL